MMIFECTSCRTRYRLDPEQIPPTGLLVRCTQCGQHHRAFLPVEAGSAKPAPVPQPPAPVPPAPPPSSSAPASATRSAAIPRGPATPAAEIQRLARVVFSDIELYNADRVESAVRDGRFRNEFAAEIEEARKMVRNRFPAQSDADAIFDATLAELCEKRRARVSAS